MLELNLPPFDIKIKKTEGHPLVFDSSRKKYVTCTPEEWVRQHFVNYLINHKGYPQMLIANEIQINLNNQRKRCDSVVYNRELRPLAIIEYKAPKVQINQKVFDQIVHYNIVLKVPYLIVSNGMNHYCCKIDYINNSFSYLASIPQYIELSE